MNKELIVDPEYGYLRLKDIPTMKECLDYYAKIFYKKNKAKYNNAAKENQAQDSLFNRSTYNDIFSMLSAHMGEITGKSIFDFGCGYGEFLFHAKEHGFDVMGAEVQPDAVSYVRERGIHVELLDQSMDVSSIAKGKKFDIVVMLGVLEHLRTPASVLKDIRTHLLTPNGYLVVRVPNEFNPLQTAANEIFSLNEWWIVPPAHINYFSKKSLSSLLDKCGFKCIESIGSFPLEIFLLMGMLYTTDQDLGKKCHNMRVEFEGNLRKAGKGELLRDIYKSLIKLDIGRELICISQSTLKSKCISRDSEPQI